MTEEWRPLPSCKGYEASSDGRIRRIDMYNSTYHGRILATVTRKDGYVCVRISVNGKAYTKYVHRLICEAFNGPPPDGKIVAHSDGDKSNNVPNNLQWATNSENEAHKIIHGTRAQGERAGSSKLTREEVLLIRSHAMFGERAAVLSALFGISISHVSRIINRQTWTHLEF